MALRGFVKSLIGTDGGDGKADPSKICCKTDFKEWFATASMADAKLLEAKAKSKAALFKGLVTEEAEFKKVCDNPTDSNAFLSFFERTLGGTFSPEAKATLKMFHEMMLPRINSSISQNGMAGHTLTIEEYKKA